MKEVDEMATISMTRMPAAAKLTTREKVVLASLSEHATLEDIARQLFVTRNTVKSQVSSAYRKLGVSTRSEAIAAARDLGLN